jgi:hypothetical protein
MVPSSSLFADFTGSTNRKQKIEEFASTMVLYGIGGVEAVALSCMRDFVLRTSPGFMV